jgi:hypothetical protein
MGDDHDLTWQEKLCLAALIVGLTYFGIVTDHRTEVAPRPDWLEYANTIGEIAVSAAEIYFLLRIRRIVGIVFSIIIEVLISYDILVPFEWRRRWADDERPTSEERDAWFKQKQMYRAGMRSTRRERLIQTLIGTIGIALALMIAGALGGQLYREVNNRISPVALTALPDKHIASRGKPPPHAKPHPSAICIPGYCTTESGTTMCVLPNQSNPTLVARAILPPNATAVQVQELAIRIVSDNAATLGSRSDRQIPPGTRLIVAARPRICAR